MTVRHPCNLSPDGSPAPSLLFGGCRLAASLGRAWGDRSPWAVDQPGRSWQCRSSANRTFARTWALQAKIRTRLHVRDGARRCVFLEAFPIRLVPACSAEQFAREPKRKQSCRRVGPNAGDVNRLLADVGPNLAHFGCMPGGFNQMYGGDPILGGVDQDGALTNLGCGFSSNPGAPGWSWDGFDQILALQFDRLRCNCLVMQPSRL